MRNTGAARSRSPKRTVTIAETDGHDAVTAT
jgi:hypothetical protein